jgi:Lipocalin-like domain
VKRPTSREKLYACCRGITDWPWKLVSFEFEFESGHREAAYDDAKGSLIITADGRFVAIVADNARTENDQPSVLFDRMMAYTGPYQLKGEDTVVIDVDVAWHPSWVGSEQTRHFIIKDGMLSIISTPVQHPKHPGQLVRGVINWRREKTG